ncbi:MAG: hypothetical protein J0L53_11910 [Spirochaetes bacterium]|nr:hypothetical protein [Spirochaetota bacterium]
MINENLYTLAVVLLNLPVVAVAGLTLTKVPRGAVKIFFLLTLLAGAVWLNGLLYFWSVYANPVWTIPALKAIFASGVILLIAFAEFIRHLANNPQRDYILYAFYAAAVPVLAFIFNNLVASGVTWATDRPGVLNVEYGPMRLYFVAHFLLFGAYIFYKLWRLIRSATDEVIVYQLRDIFNAGWLTFALIGLMNTLVPIFVNKTAAVLLGPVFPLLFLFRVCMLLLKGERLVLTRQFDSIIAAYDGAERGKNLTAWRELLTFFSRSLESSAPEMNRELPFAHAGGTFQIKVTKLDSNSVRKSGVNAEHNAAERFFPGIVEQSIALDRDNKRMFFALMRAEDLLKEKLMPAVDNQFESKRTPAGDLLSLEQIDAILATNYSEMEAMTGVGFYCFSKNFAEAVQKSMHLARARQPMLFIGERGTGRSVLARVANHAAENLPVVDLYPEHAETFPAEVAKLLAAKERAAIIVHNLSVLKPDQIQLIEKLYRVRAGELALYITGNLELRGAGLDLPGELKQAASLTVNVPTLAERSEDVFHLGLAFLRDYRNLYPEVPFQAVNAPQLKTSLERAEPLEIAEIREHVLKLCLAASPPLLAPAAAIGAEKQLRGGMLSALEESERSIIRSFLLKNKMNKRRTSIELDITINTLIAKIKKYKLDYLFQR